MHDIMTKTYKVTDSAGVGANLVVVQGTNEYECKKPGAANAGSILGVTTEAQTTQNRQVNVMQIGIARITAASAIAVGATVNVADTAGKIKTANEAAGTKINVVGMALQAASADGDIIDVILRPGGDFKS